MARAAMRDCESIDQFYERVQDAMQKALDNNCKRLHVVVGVDYGELTEKEIK
jgi:archaellum component FlaF (FlaF/FlaG flagellin family)